jgi:hypothetical protein
MPTKPPIVENTSPHIDSIEAFQRLGTSPPSVEPIIAPIQISRLALTRPSYRESALDSTGRSLGRQDILPLEDRRACALSPRSTFSSVHATKSL